MSVHELKQMFTQIKNYDPSDANELLDFAGQCYICGQISIIDYRNIVKILEENGATKPIFSSFGA